MDGKSDLRIAYSKQQVHASIRIGRMSGCIEDSGLEEERLHSIQTAQVQILSILILIVRIEFQIIQT